jgi:hypothetical protein
MLNNPNNSAGNKTIYEMFLFTHSDDGKPSGNHFYISNLNWTRTPSCETFGWLR